MSEIEDAEEEEQRGTVEGRQGALRHGAVQLLRRARPPGQGEEDDAVDIPRRLQAAEGAAGAGGSDRAGEDNEVPLYQLRRPSRRREGQGQG